MKKHIFYSYIIIFLFSIICSGKVIQQVHASITPPSNPVPTIDYVLPYPGILPGHPLYPIKLLRDRIIIWVTRSSIKKSELHLLLSDKRIAMGKLIWEKKDFDQSTPVFEDAEMHLLQGVMELVQYKKVNSLPPGIRDKYELAAKKHEEILQALSSASNDANSIDKLHGVLAITHQAMQQIASLK